MENKPEYIFVHCTDSLWGSASAVTAWHSDPKPKGRGWPHVGYHYLILNGRMSPPIPDGAPSANYIDVMDGHIQQLLAERAPGIHAPPYNQRSIAVCLVGKTKFTDRQRAALLGLVAGLRKRYNIPVANVLGHCESSTEKAKGAGAKTCPNLDMPAFREELERVMSEMKLDW